MAAYNYTLNSYAVGNVLVSVDEANTIREIQGNSLVPDMTGAAQLWKNRLAEMRMARLQSHGDILFNYIAATMAEKQEEFRASLLGKTTEASNDFGLSIDVFTYKHAEFIQHISERKLRESTMSPSELTEHNTKMSSAMDYMTYNGLKDELYVMNSFFDHDTRDLVEEMSLHAEDIDNILRFTDISQRLALRFGGINFVPYVATLSSEDVDEHGLRVMTKAIRLFYKPFGPTKKQLKKALDCYAKNKERRGSKLLGTEKVVIGPSSCRFLPY